MTKELANEIVSNSSRCTEAALRAFGIDAIPKTGSGVLEQLRENGFKVWPQSQCLNETMKQLKAYIDLVDCGRIAKSSWLIYTKGHAMAVIEGHLIDTAGGRWNNRKIEFLWKVEKI